MKITITVPDKKAKSLIATAALAYGQAVPNEILEAIDKSPEIDITKELEEDKDTALLIPSLTLIASSKL